MTVDESVAGPQALRSGALMAPPLPHREVSTLPLGDPTGGADGLRWRHAVDGPTQYPHVAIDRSVEIVMSDSIRLQATVIRPADANKKPVTSRFPSVININPYNRAFLDSIDIAIHSPGLRWGTRAAADALGRTHPGQPHGSSAAIGGGVLEVFGINRNLVKSGYVQVIVDVRGTGASHGKWQILGPREQRDSVEICQWVAEQPWCDGTYGLAGWSYSAINSLQLADKRPDGLKAIFAVEGCEDIVRDIYITGGLPSAFIPLWLSIVNTLKWLPNPSNALRDLANGNAFRWLGHRIASPATEISSLAWGFLTGRDNRIYDDPYFDERDPRISRIDVPTFLFGGWHDLFGRSATSIYEHLDMEPGRKQLVVANGYHVDAGAGFGGATEPPRIDVLERAWFDRWLKDIDNGVQNYGPVTLEQQGGGWTEGASYPRTGATVHRLHLCETGSGTADHAVHDGSLGSKANRSCRALGIHPDLRGLRSRDMTQVSAGVTAILGNAFTIDARYQERGGLSFTTAAVAERTLISGALNLHLYVRTSSEEGIWVATVNDVAPDGTSTVLTNGALTMSNRAIDRAQSMYADDGTLLAPYHYLSRVRKQPVAPYTAIGLDIDLVPTDAVLEIGHRLRVNVYAASAPRYLTVVPDLIRARRRRQALVLDPSHPSYLSFLAIGDPQW